MHSLCRKRTTVCFGLPSGGSGMSAIPPPSGTLRPCDRRAVICAVISGVTLVLYPVRNEDGGSIRGRGSRSRTAACGAGASADLPFRDEVVQFKTRLADEKIGWRDLA